MRAAAVVVVGAYGVGCAVLDIDVAVGVRSSQHHPIDEDEVQNKKQIWKLSCHLITVIVYICQDSRCYITHSQ